MTEVRRVTPDQWELLREVRLRALAEAPEAFGSTYEREAAFDEAEWRRRLAGPWYVAFDGEQPVGLVAGFVEDGTHLLVSMWVAREYRGQGIAPRLLDPIVDWARADGAAALTLAVAEGNERAEAVYTRYGFTRTGRTEQECGARTMTTHYMALPL